MLGALFGCTKRCRYGVIVGAFLEAEPAVANEKISRILDRSQYFGDRLHKLAFGIAFHAGDDDVLPPVDTRADFKPAKVRVVVCNDPGMMQRFWRRLRPRLPRTVVCLSASRVQMHLSATQHKVI